MKQINDSIKRKVCQAIALLFGLQSVLAVAAPETLTISDQPIFLQSDLPPNFVVTLDDSGSMQFGFTPDSVCGSNVANLRTRRYRSGWFNSQYYDPRVFYPPAVKEDGTPLETSFDEAFHNGFAPEQGSINLNFPTYRVWWSYNPANGTVPLNFTTGNTCGSGGNIYAENPADFSGTGTSAQQQTNRRAPRHPFYYVYDPATPGCTAPSLNQDACYRRVWVGANSGLNNNGTPWNQQVGADERQNFANWYSFYRVRNLAAITGASRAFVSLEPSVRVAWQALNTCNSFNGSCAGWNNVMVDNRIRSFSGAHRKNFYNWLFRLPANNGTPLRGALVRAGEYFRTSGITSPYAEDPQVKLGSEWGCRVNYSLLMTDGLWNNDAGLAVGNVDGTSISELPDDEKTPFTAPMSPYSDSAENTLADIAFNYWATDLRPDLSNTVPPYLAVTDTNTTTQFWNARNDPATWQHMVTFTVGFGLKRGLAQQDVNLEWGGNTYNGSYPNLVNNTKSWPAAFANSNATVSDLWHAAINSRGQFFPADQPDELRAAFEAVVNRVQEKPTAFAAVTTNSGKLTGGTQLFQPLYNPGEWSGDLRRIALLDNGSLPTQVNGVYPAVWSAKDLLKTVDHVNRNIITTVGGSAVAFKEGALSNLDFLKLLNGDSADLVKARLNWLRGDSSQEGPETTHKLRVRKNTKLGDIVNSSPLLVSTPDGSSDDPSFLEYVAKNCSANEPGCTGTRPPVVYVGANDGMLHGFDAKTGAELIAYIPEAVQDRLKHLPSSGYTHKFYVDGSPVSGNIKVNGKWKTVLVGGLGAGGRGIYALDVSNPGTFSSSPTSVVIWDFTSKNDSDLGYTFGEPLIRTMPNGRPAAIFGNGYNSDGKKAILFIKYLDNKNEAPTKIEAGSQNDSGLSSPSVADTNGDGKIDTAYAGDLKGNLWRFDLITNTSSKLYSATTVDNAPQSITTAPAVMFHPRGGIFVLVGTGQALQASDLSLSKDDSGKDTTPRMTIYGVWDTKGVFASKPNGVPIADRSKLEKREFAEVVSNGETYRTLKGNPISWYDDPANLAGKLGWYVDLPDPGEKIVFSPVIRSGAAWFLSSVASSDTCSQAGSSWLMKFNALAGLPIPNVFKSDAPELGGTKSSGVGNFTISKSGCSGGVCKTETISKSNGQDTTLQGKETNAPLLPGRVNWRDITQ